MKIRWKRRVSTNFWDNPRICRIYFIISDIIFCHFYKIKVLVTTTYDGQSNTSIIENYQMSRNLLKIDMAIDQICLYILIKRPTGPQSYTWVPFLGKKHACMLITSGQKNTNLVEGVEYLPPVKVRWIPFSGSRQEVAKFSAYQRHGGRRGFPIVPKNRNLVEGFASLLPAKFRGIPFSGCRGVENVSVNQRLGWQSWYSIFPDVNFGYMCPMTLTLEIWPWSSSWITLGSSWILWNNIQI